MSAKSFIDALSRQEQLNVLLTNRIPRRWATLLMGRFSRVEIPLIRDLSIGLWRLFADDLNLQEAKRTHFKSMHKCFIRELKPETRSIDRASHVIISPRDAMVGAHGEIKGTEALGMDLFLGSNLSLNNPNYRSLRCGECHAGGPLTDHNFELRNQVAFNDWAAVFAPGMPGVGLFPEPLGRSRTISGFALEGELAENPRMQWTATSPISAPWRLV